MSTSPEERPKAGKKLTLKAMFWRSWIAGTLGLLIITGVSAGSTTVAYNDMSTETIRLESEIKKSIPGSAARSKASRRLVQVKRDMGVAEQALIRDTFFAVVPPIGALLVAFLISLLLRTDEPAPAADERPTASS